MQTDSQSRRSASPRRDPGEIGARAARGQRHQRLARRTAAQLAEAQLEIREWRTRPR
jgi:hypothetical protein